MPICPFATRDPHGWDGDAGSYTGGPFRIVLHTTENSNAASDLSEFDSHWAPHFLADGTEIYQLLDTGVAGSALQHTGDPQTNRLSAIQIEMVGFSGKAKDPATLANVRKLLRWIEITHNVPRVWPNGFCVPAVNGQDSNHHNRSVAGWLKGGYFGHEHVPENIHWDPALTKAETDYLMADA